MRENVNKCVVFYICRIIFANILFIYFLFFAEQLNVKISRKIKSSEAATAVLMVQSD